MVIPAEKINGIIQRFRLEEELELADKANEKTSFVITDGVKVNVSFQILE